MCPPRALHFQQGTYEQVLKLLPPDRSARILDVGAGEGFFCRQLKGLGYRVEACDVAGGNFKCAGVPFLQTDLRQLPIPLPSDRYDAVVCIEVIEHMENHFQFLEELVRLTKPGGCVIVTTPNIQSLSSRWHFLLYGYTDCAPYPLDPAREEYFMEHINPISLSELLFLFERFGVEMEVLTTNRYRRGSRILGLLLRPILTSLLRWKFLRRRDARFHALRCRHMHWVLHPANLMGRITIAKARKPPRPKVAPLAAPGLRGCLKSPIRPA